VIAALASRLAAGAVNAAGTAAQQQPPLVAITPGLQLIAWSLAVAAALGIAGLAATR
jgi:hypothetical protein